MSGKLVILSGPSGAGKSTIAQHLLKQKNYNLAFSVSACSRNKRENEVDGKDYYFMSIDVFKAKIDDNEFLEWEEVYPGHYYGTLKIEVEKLRSLGYNVLLDVDVVGGLNIKRKYKEKALALFVSPPSVEILEQRLNERKTNSPDDVSRRLRKVKMEMSYGRRFDHIIQNDELSLALAEAESMLDKFLNT